MILKNQIQNANKQIELLSIQKDLTDPSGRCWLI